MSTVAKPCVLIAADPGRTPELAAALAEPFARGPLEIVTTSGADDTIDQFEALRPEVVVITASLEVGDARSLIGTLRRMLPRAEVAVVVVGDDDGPVKTAIDALELAPDKFDARPFAAKALRFAVEACLDAVVLVRDSGGGAPDGEVEADPTAATGGLPNRAAQRARWEALADSLGDEPDLTDPDLVAVSPIGGDDEAEPLPPVMIRPRRVTASEMEVVPTPSWRPGNTTDLIDDWQAEPAREPTLILRDDPAARHQRQSDPPQNVIIERGPDEPWSAPVPLSEVVEADSGRDVVAVELNELGSLDSDLELPGNHRGSEAGLGATPLIGPPGRIAVSGSGPMQLTPPSPPPSVVTPPPSDNDRPGGRDFARQLRAKMSQMAQRLFQHDTAAPAQVEVGPRHDAHTEIDLAALGEEPALVGTVTEIEMRPSARIEAREPTTSPGSWNTQVRERGLPDTGEIVRGISDAALLFAKMFSTGVTGRVAFRKDEPSIEKIVYFDQGRPVFGSSNEPGDRMGELLVREGKITAAQYERCQTHVAASGRRMGEILVDFGYLKRRELLPAVRRHVEDIVYSLFGWDHGHYHVHRDPEPSAERIRLSRHSASLILEGVRRKLDRTALEKLVGSSATVIELADRERVASVLNLGDLSGEERAALGAFDGQADLAQVARTVGLDLADVLPLAWGLCVLGLAIARRAELETPDESTALVGETDLAIDRERVRSRWALVSEADYFALLGVRRDATGFEIRRAYQAARRDFAADCFPNDLRRELAQELDEISSVLDEAFRVLRDDRLRLTYLSNLVE